MLEKDSNTDKFLTVVSLKKKDMTAWCKEFNPNSTPAHTCLTQILETERLSTGCTEQDREQSINVA